MGAYGETPVFSPVPSYPEVVTLMFYTLRVCKGCRASWMAAIAEWFAALRPNEDNDDEGGGEVIPVRVSGATHMVTREEYERMYPGRIPIAFNSGG